MNIGLFSLLLAIGANRAELPPQPALFHDSARDIDIRSEVTPTEVVFSAELPIGWSFGIAVDGDQNGVWGNGPGMYMAKRGATADHKFGLSQDGSFCAQTILASDQSDPGQILVSSDCHGYLSKGRIEVGQQNERHRVMMTIRVPAEEIFGKYPDAHLQICLWDTKTSDCRFSPAQPYILKAPPATSAP